MMERERVRAELVEFPRESSAGRALRRVDSRGQTRSMILHDIKKGSEDSDVVVMKTVKVVKKVWPLEVKV
jgi:hypothetical protein